MIRVEELRIGNYIKWIDNVVKVDLEIMKLVSENPEWAKPIDITREILENCLCFWDGVFIPERKQPEHCKWFECCMDNSNVYVSVNTAEYLLCKLNGVHELQNAYYLAMKEELEIKL